MRVGIATCKTLPEPDVDEGILLEALRRAGIEARMLAWDDPGAPFASQDLVVLRSTWNYYEDVDAFLAWVARTPRLLNPATTVAWNVRKSYLRDLEARGVRIVPTRFVGRGERRDLGALLAETGWKDVVVKPLVSAGSFRTRRFAAAACEEAQRFLDELTSERDAMVQRWMPSVETYGERSLVWIDGEVTHAIRKTLRLAGGVENVTGPMEIADDERAFAHAALDAAGSKDLLYGRIDMVRDEDGALCLMELELVEPSLFFLQHPPALDRFVAAIRRRGA